MAKVEDPFAMSNVLSTAGMTATIINAFIVVRYGRRRVLLLGGLTIAGFFQLIFAVVYDRNPGQIVTGKVLVALSCLYMVAYNVSDLEPTGTTGILIVDKRA
jgi:MFS family permease